MFNLQIKCSLRDAIYIGNTHHKNTKITNSHSSNVQHLLKNGQKSDSFTAHFEQHFKLTKSRTYLRECMMFKVVNHISPIVAIKPFLKTNYNICL